MASSSTQTLTISLTPEQASRVRGAVDSGAYASDSDVIREALTLWERHEISRAADIERLKKAYEAGKASGPGRVMDVDTLLGELKSERSTRG
ncbi:ribbon-helix-helix domain-containing protein [Oryzicola mucosus]|uniref:Type II toxin-antitoxin system ParD family antitoxin n=1 Tax=Oryzicola mucosus TaxID=2767425 RepID=A0A8J6PMC0_9HYPH|nr:type II toxin-antitoxin system ParD family antitoxin [Oryzicola mucosus]MBD0414247.1 type II toxin-antitoxin system ParD family antitoxin [Oryzicola mucosus]